MLRIITAVGALLALGLTSFSVHADPAFILHQTQGSVVVRMGASNEHLVWQEVGGKYFKKNLFHMDLMTKAKRRIKAKKRPFGPSVAGGFVLFGEGDIKKEVNVVLHDIAENDSVRLHKGIPWIVEPSIQVVHEGGTARLQAVWERSSDIDGNDMAVYFYDGGANGRGPIRVIAEGPILLKDQLPEDYHRFVKSEYPEIHGSSVVFQNTEFGNPNIYRLELQTNQFTRLSPSPRFQERPHVGGPYTAWEESEKGFMESAESTIFLHDVRTGEVRKINAERGRHYQVRIHQSGAGNYAIYGARRTPAVNTPSIRIYDIEAGQEIAAEKCFHGSIFDWAATDRGVYVAQRLSGDSSRILFATWEQLKAGCK